MSTRFMGILCAAVAMLGTPSGAAAKPKAKAKKQVVALFPLLQQGGPDAATVEAVSALVEKASSLIAGVDVVAGKKLKTKLKGDPQKLLEKCGGDPVCFAKLGSKARAQEVLLGRASVREEGGVRILFLAIDVKAKSIVRKLPLELPTVDDVKPVLGAAFYELFGITDPGFLEVAGATGDVVVDGETVGSGPGPHSLKPGRHQVTVAGQSTFVMIAPGQTRTIEAQGGEVAPVATAAKGDEDLLGGPAPAVTAEATDELPLTVALAPEPAPPTPEPEKTPPPPPAPGGANASDTAPLAVAPPLSPSPAPSSEPARPRRLLRWLGIGVAGVGVAVVGVGGFFGYQARSISNSISIKSDTQLKVLQRQGDANSAASRANLLFMAGGAATLVGAALFGIDYVRQGSTVHVGVSGPASVSLSVDW